MYTIENNVPLPRKGEGTGRKTSGLTAAILKLENGQSIFVPGNGKTASATSKRVSSLVNNSIYKRVPDRKYTVRSVATTLEQGARIWRIK